MPHATTIDEVITHLDTIIAALRAEDSPAAPFAALYRRVTIAVRDHCDAGHFDDNERMRRLDVIFANRYFDAYDAYRAGQAPTPPWETAFKAASNRHLTLLQHVLLGINAHIGLDLGAAVAEIGGESGWDDTLYADFDRLNNILASMVDEAQQAVNEVSPFFGFLDVIAGRNDEAFVGTSITVARDGAWRFAGLLRDTPSDGWPEAIYKRGRVISAYALHLYRPRVWGFRLVLAFIAFGERGKCDALVARLLR